MTADLQIFSPAVIDRRYKKTLTLRQIRE